MSGVDNMLQDAALAKAERRRRRTKARPVGLLRAHRAALKNLCERIVTKERNAMGRAATRGDFRQEMAQFYAKHEQLIADTLGAAIRAAAVSLEYHANADQLLAAFAIRHCERSQTELGAAPRGGIPALLATWGQSLPDLMAGGLIETLSPTRHGQDY